MSFMFVKTCAEKVFCASEFDEVERIFKLVNPRVSSYSIPVYLLKVILFKNYLTKPYGTKNLYTSVVKGY